MKRIALFTTSDNIFQKTLTELQSKTRLSNTQSTNDGSNRLEFELDGVSVSLICIESYIDYSAVVSSLNQGIPDYIFFLGEALSADKNNYKLYDILVSNRILNYSKKTLKDIVEKNDHKISDIIISKIKHFDLDGLFYKNIKSGFRPKVQLGTILWDSKQNKKYNSIRNQRSADEGIIGIVAGMGGFDKHLESSQLWERIVSINIVTNPINGIQDISNQISFDHFAQYIVCLLTSEFRDNEGNLNVAQKDDTQKILKESRHNIGKGTVLSRIFDLKNAFLTAKTYAKVISELLIESKGEICFALMGHWGRGKTYLMRLVSNEMAPRYDCYWFSAWKYRTKPELWIHLYENIREQIEKQNMFRVLPSIFRGKVIQYGYWRIISLLCIFSIILLPLGKAVIYIIGVIGVFGLLKIIKVVSYGRRRINDLIKYFKLPKYFERLGMQAIIGKELKYLLLGLFNKRNKYSIKNIIGIFLYLSCIVAINCTALVEWNNSIINKIRIIRLYPSSSVTNGALIVGNIVFIGMLLWLLLCNYSKDKAVLIVDDLDRIAPEEMLEIIESIKLFIEDEEISEYLKVVMIFEENSIRTAIENKYSCLLRTELNRGDDALKIKSIYSENFQKLFIAHLNLPALSIEEIEKYCKEYTKNQEERELGGANIQGQPPGVNAEDEVSRKNKKDYPNSDKTERGEASGTVDAGNAELTREESEAILKAIKLIYNEKTEKVGPRGIQSFVFKYKLARKLLSARGSINIDPNLLAKLIAKVIVNKDSINTEVENAVMDNKEKMKSVLNEIC